MRSLKVKPINNNIVVRRKVRINQGVISHPDNAYNTLHFGYVESVGEKVLNLSIAEGFLVAYDGHQVQELGDSRFLIKEYDVVAVTVCGTWRPVGAKVMMVRNNDEIKLDSGIIIPACYQTSDQNLEGVITGIGLINLERYDNNLKIGDNIKIKAWDQSIFEISVGGLYNLIVPHHLLEYKKETVEA